MPRRRTVNPAATEVDAYIFIKDNLRILGWDTRNPERAPTGQVWTQNECLSNEEIRRLLDLDRPENIVKITDKLLWVIEAKRSHRELSKAVQEAEEYAIKLNKSRSVKAVMISGVAGNEQDAFLITTRFLKGGNFIPVTMNSIEVTGLLSPNNCDVIIQRNEPNIDNPPIDEKLFISRAEHINEILHLGAVNPHQRASVMAALLLSKLSSTGPNIEEKSPMILIGDINSRVKTILATQKKSEFEEYIRIALPASHDNHVKFRQALVDTIQQLDLLNIRSAMNSGADWLGAFYEVFLKYASWAQDLGIVLTPRHVTRFVADVMTVQPNDIVFDPTCGTGGFLVSAFDAVKQRANTDQLGTFKQNSVFGIEQDSGIAALAVVNMIFRGDGKNNIIEGNCFARFLKKSSNGGAPTAKYTTEQSSDPPITKVMMNPPFALKRGSDKEYKFVEQALHQMADGGILFSVLPYSAMVRPGAYLTWRNKQLLPHHTLLSVVTFPGDLFYPVGVTSLGIFVRKGVPHNPKSKVLWIRAFSDGLLKSKGKRLPNPKAKNDLDLASDTLRAFLNNPDHKVRGVNQFIKAAPIDTTDKQMELVPEAFLDQAQPTHQEVVSGLESGIRDLFAYLIKALTYLPNPTFGAKIGGWLIAFLCVASICGGSVKGRSYHDGIIERYLWVESPSDNTSIRIDSPYKVDESSLMVLGGIKSGLIIDTADNVKTDNVQVLKLSLLNPSFYFFWADYHRPSFTNVLAWKQQPAIIVSIVRLFDVFRELVLGRLQITNTCDNELRKQTDMLSYRISHVIHYNIERQYATSLIKRESRSNANIDRNPRPMRQLQLSLRDVGLSSNLPKSSVGYENSNNACNDQGDIWSVLRRKQAREIAIRMVCGPILLLIGWILIDHIDDARSRWGRRVRSWSGVMLLATGWSALLLPIYWQEKCESYKTYFPQHRINVSHSAT